MIFLDGFDGQGFLFQCLDGRADGAGAVGGGGVGVERVEGGPELGVVLVDILPGIIIGIVLFAALFFRGDLSREALGEYISAESRLTWVRPGLL